MDQVVDFWVARFNRYVIDTISQFEGPPEARLLSLMKLVKREGLHLYDLTFRAWAAQDPEIAAKVREVDRARYVFIKGLFEEMGFSGQELELRTRVWLVFASAQSTVVFPEGDTADPDCFVSSHAFFTRKND